LGTQGRGRRQTKHKTRKLNTTQKTKSMNEQHDPGGEPSRSRRVSSSCFL